jgi:hypothetical protein
MSRTVSRLFYRGLLRLHPPSFYAQFASEMLWIFDEVSEKQGVARLFADVLASLARQWIVRYAFKKLLVGDFTFSPEPHATRELFAWDRIAAPATSLPTPRLLQGGVASFAFIAFLSILGLHTGKAAAFRGGFAGGAVDSACAPHRIRGTLQVRVSDSPIGGTYEQSVSGSDVVAFSGDPDRTLEFREPNGLADHDLDAADHLTWLDSSVPATQSSARLLTAQVDNARTGANLYEKILTPANVNSAQFGKLFSFKVDGDVYAQPLYMPDVDIPGKGQHNVLFVTTEADSVYAFDADGTSTTPLWHATLANPTQGAQPVSSRDTSCFFIEPQVGITSTPAIDLKTGTLYVLARTKESKGVLRSDQFKQHLHALAITTGVEKFGGPVEITASVKGYGSGGSNGQVAFDPQRENPRAALLLANDTVYLTWGSACDIAPYHGWLISYDTHTLVRKSVFNASPDGSDSAIWQGDAGPAADKDGNVFVVTGNGTFDAATGGRAYGDSVLKLSSGAQDFKLLDYFTPSNQAQLNERDNDLGSSGPVLLPDQPGAYPHLLVTAGKEGKIYLIDRDRMGKYQPGDDPHAIQTISASHGAFGAMAYWNRNVFFIGSDSRVEDFALDGGQLKLKASGNTKFFDSGATPAISANGSKNAIVWAASSKNWNEPPTRPAVLYAYDAADVTHELYTTEQNSARDRAGVALRFAIPSIVNGKVYLGSRRQVDVYGLLSAH